MLVNFDNVHLGTGLSEVLLGLGAVRAVGAAEHLMTNTREHEPGNCEREAEQRKEQNTMTGFSAINF